MKVINDDATLRLFVPNALASVAGEASLFQKLAPHLQIAENWLLDNITGEETLDVIAATDHALYPYVARAIVCHAFSTAVPSLDLVLTPNGFGIVSNQNIAPASRDRVERLIKQLSTERFAILEQLLSHLPALEIWRESAQYAYFGYTLYPNFDVVRMLGQIGADPWAAYQSARLQLINIEAQLAENYISIPVYKRLRIANLLCSATPEEQLLVSRLRSVELSLLKGEPLNIPEMQALVDFLRKDTENFPEWTDSPIAPLFENHAFQNSKKSTAYWF